MTRVDPTAVATYALTGVSALGAGLVVVQLRIAAKENKKQNLLKRKQETIDFFSESLVARTKWQDEFPPDYSQEEVLLFAAKANRNGRKKAKNTWASINSYLGFWELGAASVFDGMFDETLFARMVAGRVVAVYSNYLPFIIQARREMDNRNLYVELRDLAALWWDRAEIVQEQGLVEGSLGDRSLPLNREITQKLPQRPEFGASPDDCALGARKTRVRFWRRGCSSWRKDGVSTAPLHSTPSTPVGDPD